MTVRSDVSVKAPMWSMRPYRWTDPKPALEQVRVLLALARARGRLPATEQTGAAGESDKSTDRR